jgi:hypothetical protein
MPFLPASKGMCAFLAGIRTYVGLHGTMIVSITFQMSVAFSVTISRFRLGMIADLSVLGHLGAASWCFPIGICFGLRTLLSSATRFAVGFSIAMASAIVGLLHLGILLLRSIGSGGLGIRGTHDANEREEGEKLFHVGWVVVDVRS